MAKQYEFKDIGLSVSGEKHLLLHLVEKLREADIEGPWSDLIYQIEYAFDIDGIRTDNEERNYNPETDCFICAFKDHCIERGCFLKECPLRK